MHSPRFSVAERPGDIVDRSGFWLAEQLGWRWVRSRRDVEVLIGRQVYRLGLELSKWSRAGLATWVHTRVAVLDKELTPWREAHSARTVFPVSQLPIRPYVYNTLLTNVDQDLAEVECSGLPQHFLAQKTVGLGEFAAAFQERVLPVLNLFRIPSLVARELPVSWLSMVTCGTIEWALAHDDREAAALLLRRHMERPLKGKQRWEQRLESFRHGWDAAPGRDGLPGPTVLVYATQSLGWLARVHDLPGPDRLREPAHSSH